MTPKTTLRSVTADLPSESGSGRGHVAEAIAPASAEDASKVLAAARDEGTPIAFAGSGSREYPGGAASPPIEMTSLGMTKVIDWQREDLTVTVDAGVRIGTLEAMLAEQRQTSLLPTAEPDRTVGGLVAEGASGYGRLRYGPTRDRVLEVTLATGYGRVVRGGGRLVKNVTGYDVPRLATGSAGSLGFIASICLKLWPAPRMTQVIDIDDPQAALATLFRPYAILETESGAVAVLEGTATDIEQQTATIGGVARHGLPPLTMDEPIVISVRVPPAHVPEAVRSVRDHGAVRWIAQHGVGVVEAAWSEIDTAGLVALRGTVSEIDGIAVVTRGHEAFGDADPWGIGVQAQSVQHRLRSAFDPAGICNPGWHPVTA